MVKAIIFDWGGTLAPSDNKIAAIRLKKPSILMKKNLKHSW
ncbi:MAG: hypothetical protein ABIC95_00900 [archaeon]